MIRIVHSPKPALPLQFLTKVQQISFCDNASVIVLHSHHVNKKSSYAQSTHIQTQTGNKTALTPPLIHTRAKKTLLMQCLRKSRRESLWKIRIHVNYLPRIHAKVKYRGIFMIKPTSLIIVQSVNLVG